MPENIETAEFFPIRELSQRCKVNTVTIRAWERRYGLLKPRRTPKGHRLYSNEDVALIDQILALMARGVPVGKVKGLLESKENLDADTYSDSWQIPTSELLEASLSFNRNQIQALLEKAFLSYPAHLCLEKLIEPTMSTLLSKGKQRSSYSYLQNEIIIYTVLRLRGIKKRALEDSVFLMCGENTDLWRLALMAVELNDHNIAIEFIAQNWDITNMLGLVKSNLSQVCVIYQDGSWKDEDTKEVTEAINVLTKLNICGTAPMMSSLKGHNRAYASPNECLNALLTVIDKKNEDPLGHR